MGESRIEKMATSTNQRVRSRIKVITDCVKLETELSKAGDRLVVLEFFSSSVSPCRKIQDDIAALSLEHTGAVFLKINLDFWEEIDNLLPRFDACPGSNHIDDANPNTFIDPSKKLVMYAHVGSSDTILQRYDIKGIPTVGRLPSLVEIDMRVFPVPPYARWSEDNRSAGG